MSQERTCTLSTQHSLRDPGTCGRTVVNGVGVLRSVSTATAARQVDTAFIACQILLYKLSCAPSEVAALQAGEVGIRRRRPGRPPGRPSPPLREWRQAPATRVAAAATLAAPAAIVQATGRNLCAPPVRLHEGAENPRGAIQRDGALSPPPLYFASTTAGHSQLPPAAPHRAPRLPVKATTRSALPRT